MSTRSKTLGLAAAIAAIAVAVPTAYAEPTPSPEPSPTTATTPASPPATTPSPATTTTVPTSTTPVPTTTKVPEPQGPGCDAYRKQAPDGTPGSIDAMALQKASEALANNPDLTIFSGFISGKLNPDINIVNVLDGGPYVVFAPTNEAFGKLDPQTLETLKTDPVVLLPTLFYHMVLGYLGPNDVQGKMPTQDGRSVTVVGKGGDIKVNDARVVCAFSARGAYIYMIDTVLTPPTPAAEGDATTSATTSPSSTTPTSPTTGAAEASPTTTAGAAEATTASPTTGAAEASPTTTAGAAEATTAAPASPEPSASPTTTTAEPAA